MSLLLAAPSRRSDGNRKPHFRDDDRPGCRSMSTKGFGTLIAAEIPARSGSLLTAANNDFIVKQRMAHGIQKPEGRKQSEFLYGTGPVAATNVNLS